MPCASKNGRFGEVKQFATNTISPRTAKGPCLFADLSYFTFICITGALGLSFGVVKMASCYVWNGSFR